MFLNPITWFKVAVALLAFLWAFDYLRADELTQTKAIKQEIYSEIIRMDDKLKIANKIEPTLGELYRKKIAYRVLEMKADPGFNDLVELNATLKIVMLDSEMAKTIALFYKNVQVELKKQGFKDQQINMILHNLEVPDIKTRR